MGAEWIRPAVVVVLMAMAAVLSPVQLAAQTPDPTEAPGEEPPGEEPAEPAEPADTTPADGGEPAPEPEAVSPAVWVGVIALVVLAVVWTVRQTTVDRSRSTDDGHHR